jgi:hypothetical protein
MIATGVAALPSVAAADATSDWPEQDATAAIPASATMKWHSVFSLVHPAFGTFISCS